MQTERVEIWIWVVTSFCVDQLKQYVKQKKSTLLKTSNFCSVQLLYCFVVLTYKNNRRKNKFTCSKLLNCKIVRDLQYIKKFFILLLIAESVHVCDDVCDVTAWGVDSTERHPGQFIWHRVCYQVCTYLVVSSLVCWVTVSITAIMASVSHWQHQ